MGLTPPYKRAQSTALCVFIGAMTAAGGAQQSWRGIVGRFLRTDWYPLIIVS